MALPPRGTRLVTTRLPAAVMALSSLALATAPLPAQTPPVRGGASGELRTPSGFSPIELHNTAANETGPATSRVDRRNSFIPEGGKTPIRRESTTDDEPRGMRTGVSSPWTTLGALAIALLGLFAVTRLLRRVSGRSAETLPADAFDVIASRRLEGQTSIHLVRIGKRIVAVGTSPAGVQPLTTIDDPLDVEDLLSGGAARRLTADADRPLFGGSRPIRRGNDLAAAGPPAASGAPNARRTSAALVPAGEPRDA